MKPPIGVSLDLLCGAVPPWMMLWPQKTQRFRWKSLRHPDGGSCPRAPAIFGALVFCIGKKAGQEQVPRFLRGAAQGGIRMQCPGECYAQQHDLRETGQLRSRYVAPHFAALWRDSKNLGQKPPAGLKPFVEFRADG